MGADVANVTGYFRINGDDLPAGPFIAPGHDFPLLIVTHRPDIYDRMPETIVTVSRETVDMHDRLDDQIRSLVAGCDGAWSGELILESYEGKPLRRIVIRGTRVVVERARMSWPDGTAV